VKQIRPMPALFAARACARGAGVGVRRMHTAQLRLAATPPVKVDVKKEVGNRNMTTRVIGEPSPDFYATFEESCRDLYRSVDLVSQTHPFKFFLGVVTFSVLSLKLYDAKYGAHRYAIDMRGGAGAAGDDDDEDDDE